MTSGREPHRKFVTTLHAQAMDGDIRFMSVGIGGVAQPHSDIRTCVFFGVGWRGQQFAQVKTRIVGEVDHLLAQSPIRAYRHRRNGIFHRVSQQMSQIFRFAVEKMSYAAA